MKASITSPLSQSQAMKIGHASTKSRRAALNEALSTVEIESSEFHRLTMSDIRLRALIKAGIKEDQALCDEAFGEEFDDECISLLPASFLEKEDW